MKKYTVKKIFKRLMQGFKIKFENLTFIIFIILFLWLLSILVAPLSLPENAIKLGDKGKVGSIDHKEIIDNIDSSFVRAIYLFGDCNCHQMERRSFFVNGNQLPLCARDLGIFIGLSIGTFALAIISFELKWYLVVIFILPMGIDGGLQYLTPYESANILRLLTGLLAGTISGMAIGYCVRTLRES